MGADRSRQLPAALAVAALGVTSVVLTRLRTQWPEYVALHRRLAELGVPDWARHLDYPLIALSTVALGAGVGWWAAGVSPHASLRLGRPHRGFAIMIAAASAPMLAGGAILGLSRGGTPPWASLWPACIRAPIVEELVFRSLLIGTAWALLADSRRAFWPIAALSSAVFGLTHVPWSIDGLASGWATLLVTSVGGLWYAWLMRQWGSVLVPMLLHAAMNLGWLLAAASGGAGGGGLSENLLRVATIAIATTWTIRRARHQGPPRGTPPHRAQPVQPPRGTHTPPASPPPAPPAS